MPNRPKHEKIYWFDIVHVVITLEDFELVKHIKDLNFQEYPYGYSVSVREK